jgi:hypothetical protein
MPISSKEAYGHGVVGRTSSPALCQSKGSSALLVGCQSVSSGRRIDGGACLAIERGMSLIHRSVELFSRCGLVALLIAMALTACEGQRATNEPGGSGGRGTGGAAGVGSGGNSPATGTGGSNTGGNSKTGGAPATGGRGGMGGSSGEGGRVGTGGAGGGRVGTGGAGGGMACAVPQTERLYMSPGCGANVPEPLCGLSYPCRQYACGCDGTWTIGCNGFRAPYAWMLPTMELGWAPDAGTCDPQNPPAM